MKKDEIDSTSELNQLAKFVLIFNKTVSRLLDGNSTRQLNTYMQLKVKPMQFINKEANRKKICCNWYLGIEVADTIAWCVV